MPTIPNNPSSSHQDFQTVVFKRRPTAATSKTLPPLSSARLAGRAPPRGKGKQLVATERSHNRSAHTHSAGAGARLHKLDESSTSTKHARVTPEFAKALQRERLARKWTQKQLAQHIHEKPQVVHAYESGQAIPNGAITQKLNKALGGRLPSAKRKT